MKSIFITLNVLVLMFLVGCGGGDNNVPPPLVPQLGMNNPIDQQQMQDMFALAQQAKGTCANSGTQAMLPLVMTMMGPNAGGMPPMLPPLGGDCQDSMTNFILMFMTMKNGQYANHPEPKKWFMAQMAGLLNMVGANFQNKGINIPSSMLPQLYTAGWQMFQRDIFPSSRFQQVKPQVCGGAAEFGLGC